MQNTERLESALTGAAQQQTEQMQASLQQAIESLKPQIELMITVSIMAVTVYILLKVLDTLHKRRIEKAIIRMDKNLELLVADKITVKSRELTEVSGPSEQK